MTSGVCGEYFRSLELNFDIAALQQMGTLSAADARKDFRALEVGAILMLGDGVDMDEACAMKCFEIAAGSPCVYISAFACRIFGLYNHQKALGIA